MFSISVNNVEDRWHQTQCARKASDVADDLRSLISDTSKDEIAVQAHMEENTELFYLPELKNHGLHFNCIISKMPVGSEFCDYAYLTKSSDLWRLVLVELESPHTQIFHKTAANSIDFTHGFNHAYGQILKWRNIYSKTPDKVLSQLSVIRKPLASNDIELRYCLVIGRRSEYENSQEKRDLFMRHGIDSNVNIMSWDSYISGLANQRPTKKAILAIERHGFRIKNMDGRPGNIFGWVSEADLHLTKSQTEELKADGYDIDAWRDGHLLRVDGKKIIDSINILPALKNIASVVETVPAEDAVR